MSLFDSLFNRDINAPRNYTRRIGDWSTNPPHLLLLSRFLTAQTPTPLGDEWKDALGEPSKDAMERFISLGLLVPAPADAAQLACSADARVLVEKYLARQEEEKAAALAESLAGLRSGDFAQASRAVSRYEAGQVFPRPAEIPWAKHDTAADVARLSALFAARPQNLQALAAQDLAALHVAAGMLLLWGSGDAHTWLPTGFVGMPGLDVEAAIQTLLGA